MKELTDLLKPVLRDAIDKTIFIVFKTSERDVPTTRRFEHRKGKIL